MATQEELFNHPGWQACNRLGAFANMHNIFLENYNQFKGLCDKLKYNESLSNEFKKEIFMHLERYIFNYLSSASALIEHSRHLTSFYKDTDFYTEYDKRIKNVFEKNDLALFIKKLRNYQVHVGLPCPYIVASQKDTKSWDIVFISQELLDKKNDWNLESKKFINTCGKEIILNDVFYQYTNLVNSFYLWVYEELKKYHKDELIEKERIEKELGIFVPSII